MIFTKLERRDFDGSPTGLGKGGEGDVDEDMRLGSGHHRSERQCGRQLGCGNILGDA